MRIAQYLAGCCAVLAALAGIPAVLGWAVTRHRLRRGGRTVGEAVGTTVKEGMTYSAPYTHWQQRHALVRYTDHRGGEYTMTAGPDLRIGTPVPLVYNPRHPDRAQEETTASDLRAGVISLAVALALVAVILLT